MEILYSDTDIAVCIKPVGLDSEKQVPEALKEKLGGEFFTIHRLDLNVGGVMVYARNKKTAAALSKAVQNKSMIKEYFAMVHGIPEKEGDWENLLWKDSKKNKVFVVKRMRNGVKKARLEFKRLKVYENPSPLLNTSLVRIRLHTGRSHQIRVQFASRKFPLVGDHKYGSKGESKIPMLFSCKIIFPYKGENVSFEAFPSWTE